MKERWYRFLAIQAVVGIVLATCFFFWLANIVIGSIANPWMATQAIIVLIIPIFIIGVIVDRRTRRREYWRQYNLDH